MKNIRSNELLKNKAKKDISTTFKQNCSHGITLISLVITIIILIILAGVAINLSLGQNGIFNRAKQAKESYTQSVAREKLETVLAEATIEKETNNSYNNNEFLDNMLEEKGIAVNGNSVIVDNYNFVIDRDKLEIVTSNGEALIKLGKEIQKYKGKNDNNKYEVEILLKIESSKELQSVKIEKADGTQIQVSLEELEEGKNITIELDEEYEVTCVTSDGQTQTRKLFENSEETIRTAKELSEFRDKVNKGLTYEGKTIKLGNDIDLGGVCGNNVNGKDENWKPIGYYNTDDDWASFYGTFNGQYNTLKNLYININENNIEKYDSENSLYEYNYFGLFGYNSGKIENLIMENVYIYVDLSSSLGVADYCQVIGGIVGQQEGKLINLGVKSGSITSINTVQPNILYRDQYVGGIAGVVYNGEINNCYNNANISVTNSEYYSSDIRPGNKVGGIMGEISNPYIGKSSINNCYNTGKVESNGSYENLIGGIVGRNLRGEIINCYNYGQIIGDGPSANYLGGIVGRNGWNASTKGTITNSYCTTTSSTYSYYELNKNGMKTTGRIGEQVLKGYAQTLNGDVEENEKMWIDDIVEINNGYPILKWQIPENR